MSTMNRRQFTKSSLAGLAAGWAASRIEAAPRRATTNRLGWTLSCAAYSFNKLSFYETIDQVKALGLDAIEGFEWQRLSPEKPKTLFNDTMSAADRKEARQRLSDAGIRLTGCYWRKLEELDASRRAFEFAKDLAIPAFVVEPSAAAYDMLERLCNEYQIDLAVHNHPQPSPYWNPDVFLERAKGHGRRIGACADTGHWVRSGLDPVEMLRKVGKRTVSFHLKDVDAATKTSGCVPWGTGVGKIAEILEEAKRQGFRGAFGIEYEPYSPENAAKIAQCIAFFDQQVARLEKSA